MEDHESMQPQDHSAHMMGDFRRRFWVCAALTVPVLALSNGFWALFGRGPLVTFAGDRWVLLALATVIYVWGGAPFHRGLAEESRTRTPGMMTLVSVAITVAYLYSAATFLGLPGMDFFWELATLVDIMLLGHWLEMRSVMSAGSALEALVKLMPTEAHRLAPDGSTEDVEVSALVPGDRIVVKPGEKLPVDGTVVEGRTSVDQALVTGESQPVPKGEGDDVIGGSINAEGSVTVEVTKAGNDSYLAQVVELVRSAQASRSKTQALADRAAGVLVFVALGGGVATFAAWLVAGRSLTYALERAVTVMVIACPHALGLAIPLVVAVSTAIAAGNGLLIRNRNPFDEARLIDTVVFDKTGTLTEGRFAVTDTVALGDIEPARLLELAAAVEARSEHPIAQAIANEVERPADVAEFEALPGRGARGTVGGTRVAVVSPGYLGEHGLAADDPRTAGFARDGKTVVYVLADERVAGAVALADVVRPESRQAVAALRAAGVKCVMLTGDSDEVAAAVARDIGLDDYVAGVLPERKAAEVSRLRSEGRRVAMVGDGVNDAPALATADLGIAIGAGTDVAVETADVVLVRSDPRDVGAVIALSSATYRKMRQNLVWATGYNALAIPIAAGALAWAGITLSPAVGAVFMSLSTVIVAVNARLLRAPGH